MSLKRPGDELDTIAHSFDRPETSFAEYGSRVDINPLLHDQSWASLTNDLLGPGYVDQSYGQHGAFGSSNEESALDSGLICFAQEQIEEWAVKNMHMLSETPASVPEPDPINDDICYGMIYRAPLRLLGDMRVVIERLNNSREAIPGGQFAKLGLTNLEKRLVATFADGAVLGELNTQLENVLEAINGQGVDLEVLAPIKAICESIGRITKEKDAVVRVNINFYGPRSHQHRVGRELSNRKLYLQKPDYIRDGVRYKNPQVLEFPHMQTDDALSQAQPDHDRLPECDTAASFRKAMTEVYSALTRSQKLTGLEGDGHLKTVLLQHQKEALEFMAQRENGPIPDEYMLWKTQNDDDGLRYRHLITGTSYPIPQEETGGGILADEMGMGKTLSVLALVIRTLQNAYDWANTTDATSEIVYTDKCARIRERSKGTLIVASSDLMINEWMQEMYRHFDAHISKRLRTIKYHGPQREKDIETLRNADIILTTYHTLASDYSSKRNLLENIQWFRLVLDEAHIIRRQSTALNRTVTQLKARSRWCLTGTPIQNRLDDIASLFAFLDIPPFQNIAVFRKHISTPYDEKGKPREIAIERLTRLLDAMCLRRTKDRLHLPEPCQAVHCVEFSPDEREQYEQTKRMMFRAVRNQAGHGDHGSTLGMFQVQLQLRILCNHGTYQQPFSWNRRKEDLLDEREDLENAIAREGEISCSMCKQMMLVLSTGSMYKRYAGQCAHVLCSECIPRTDSRSQDPSLDTQNEFPASCPICTPLYGTPSQSQSMVTLHSENYFRNGQSSKMVALVNDLLKELWYTKSIVFSCWTHTLDLIEIHLRSAHIDYGRIDGECSTSNRKAILDNFSTDPQSRVLIMTTGTGAVGLNLAVANRVFIVEPQWNPSVERQAIARALRLGQENTVQVTRYVVNGTVEQEMRSLQEKKLALAGIW